LHDGGFFVHWILQAISYPPNFEPVLNDNGFEDAFSSLAGQIMDSEVCIICDMKDNFFQNMDENDRLTLSEMIPCFAPLSGPFDPSASNSAHVNASGRQLQIFSSLLRLVASPTRFLVLFLDNLQYSEP
jgi:hypothetical protein